MKLNDLKEKKLSDLKEIAKTMGIECVDSDEWFTDEEIDYTIDYVRTHSQETFFEIQYKNYLDDDSKYYD